MRGRPPGWHRGVVRGSLEDMNGGTGGVRRRVVVTGLVQGVFFRDACRRTADRNAVTGWVRNLPDDTVEAVFEGAPGDVDAMVLWAHQGPEKARVRSVTVHDEPPEGLTGFVIRPTPRE